MKVSVNWLKDFIAVRSPFESVAEGLTLAGLEVKKIHESENPKDCLFEIEITTNRPDWLSHLGVAREIAAVENLPLKLPPVDADDSRTLPPGWKVVLREKEGCPYYSGVLIEGLEMNPTPDFIKDRLLACGIRSINLIVDITNYVLLETGQPLHAFDADLIAGKEVLIRHAKKGEKMISIDGKERILEENDLVIADKDRPIAVAGVMGGKDTEVSERTRNIFLESAFFHPRWVRQTSKRLGLSSDSSYRFERRVDPCGVDFGRQRALYLFKKYAKPRFVSSVIKTGQTPEPVIARIRLSVQEIKKWLGFEIKPHLVSSILQRLGLESKQMSQEFWQVVVPSFRADLTRPVDLIEEIARIYGYDNLPSTLPAREPLLIPSNPLLALEDKAREYMVACGFSETVTFSLISDRGFSGADDLSRNVRIVNPQNKELRWLRHHMLPSLLSVVEKNYHGGLESVPVFEIANVYCVNPETKKPQEEKVLAVAVSGLHKGNNWLDHAREVTFYDLKGLVEGLCESMGLKDYGFKTGADPLLSESPQEELVVCKQTVGFLGEVAPRFHDVWGLKQKVFFAQLHLEKAIPLVARDKRYAEIPRFPPVRRDLAVVVAESVKAGELIRYVFGLKEEYIRHVEIFDVFRGGRIPKGYKNLALRVTYQSADRTLVSDEIQQLHSKIAAQVVRQFEATFQ